MLTSFVAEPLFTGLGAGGYMLVAGGSDPPVLLDFFVEAPGREAGSRGRPLRCAASTSTSARPSRPSTPGRRPAASTASPAGVCAANARWGTWPLADLVAPAAELARRGVPLNREQAYVVELLEEPADQHARGRGPLPAGRPPPWEGDVMRNPELADTLERLGRDGDEPFYRGDIADAVCDWIAAGGGSLGCADLRAYEAILREPVRVAYRGREVLSNPPPSAGGTLLAYSLSLLERADAPPALEQIVGAMAMAQAERTPEFVDGLAQAGFLERFLGGQDGLDDAHRGARLGRLRLQRDDLDRRGLGRRRPRHRDPPQQHDGRGGPQPARLPSPRARPSPAEHDGADDRDVPAPPAGVPADVELVLGQRRIQPDPLGPPTDDHWRRGPRLTAAQAVRAPRVHFEDGRVYAEPGIDVRPLERAGHTVTQFAAPQPLLRRRPGRPAARRR